MATPPVYNPHAGRITGLEWVPIREPATQFNRFDTTSEIGFTFTLNQFTPANRVFFYIKEFPPDFIIFQPYTVSIYPRGLEAATGPIDRIVANVSTLSNFSNAGTVSALGGLRLINANTVASALQDPSQDAFVNAVTGDGADFDLNIQFNMAPYANRLTQKRILGVNVLWAMDYEQAGLSGNESFQNYSWLMQNNSMVIGSESSFIWPIMELSTFVPATVNRTPVGDTNPNFKSNTALDFANTAPWTPSEVARFGSSGVDKMVFNMNVPIVFASPSGSIESLEITYMALEVIFCEEQRVAFGTHMFTPFFSNHYTNPPTTNGRNVHDISYNFNQNQVNLIGALSGNANPILPPGDYTMTLMQSTFNDKIQARFPVPPPTLQTPRQLYEIPSIECIQINRPVPLDNTILGQTFTVTSTNVLPQMSMWTSGSPGTLVVDIPAYGRQTQGWVANAFNLTQGIVNNATQAAYARFYARRFGTTVAPLVLTSPTLNTGSTTSVFITPDEFDLLDPIVDGWKEVTLLFSSPITVSGAAGTVQTWTWSSSASTGDRWEVLGASALALSGAPDNIYVQYPTYVPYGATYGGTSAFETWAPSLPPVLTPTADTSSDAVLMLADQYAAPTLSLAQVSQPLSGIGNLCGIVPDGVPSALTFNQLSWAPGNQIGVDNFSRFASNGWGSPWTKVNGTDSDFSVNGSQGVIVASSSAFDNLQGWNAQTYTDSETLFKFAVTAMPNTTAQVVSAHRQSVFLANYYRVSMTMFNDFTMHLDISKTVATVTTQLTSLNALLPYRGALGKTFFMRTQCVGSFIRAKVWPADEDEPDVWQRVAFDTSLTAAGTNAIGSKITSTIVYEDFLTLPYNQIGTTYSLERMDTIDTSWQVIMKGTDLTKLSFNDFEARVGILTSYRMRLLDSYEFQGTYSSTVTSTIAAPGATGSDISGQGQHILLFTTNERQLGSSNLAYSSAWTNQVTEDFTFPEAGFTQLQAMYNKDFYTAFRPLERGGDQFTRTVLVNAAAISAPTLPGFTRLSDMAWDQVSYICVRDEQGNRWFANVQVPTGSVVHKRQLYTASVKIAEVTDTPSVVTP